MTYQLVNETTGRTLANEARLARSLWERFAGLMGRRVVPGDFALGIAACDWVHSLGVLVPLDVAYCGAEGQVVRIISHLKPGRLASRAPGAQCAWEMAAGYLAPYVRVGDCLTLRQSPASLV